MLLKPKAKKELQERKLSKRLTIIDFYTDATPSVCAD